MDRIIIGLTDSDCFNSLNFSIISFEKYIVMDIVGKGPKDLTQRND